MDRELLIAFSMWLQEHRAGSLLTIAQLTDFAQWLRTQQGRGVTEQAILTHKLPLLIPTAVCLCRVPLTASSRVIAEAQVDAYFSA